MKKFFFCNVHFSLGKKQIRENTCLKQHALFSRFIGCFKNYSYFQIFMFFRFRKGAKSNEKRYHLGSPFCAWSSLKSQMPHSDPQSELQRRPFRVLEGSKGSELAGHPENHVFLVFADPVNHLWMKRLFVNVCKIVVF